MSTGAIRSLIGSVVLLSKVENAILVESFPSRIFRALFSRGIHQIEIVEEEKWPKERCQAQSGRQESRGRLRIGQKNVGSYSAPSSSRSAPRSMDSHWTLARRTNVCRCRWDWRHQFQDARVIKDSKRDPFKHRKSLHFPKYQLHQLREKKHEDSVENENKCKQIPSKPKMRAEHKIFKLFVYGNRLSSLLGCYFQ